MKSLMLSLACLGMIFAPAIQVNAEIKQGGKKVAPISDVALEVSGSLQGKVVDAQGKTLNGAQVTVFQNKKKVATTITDREGNFQVTELTTGIYEIKAGQGSGAVRVWANKIAPPTAKPKVLVVSGNTTARAQGGMLEEPRVIDYAILGLSITGVVLSGVALGNDDGNTTTIVSP